MKLTALAGINLNFRTSEFAAILGPSGSGKTTLLNIIGGLDQYTSGDLIIDGKSTKKFKDKDWDAYRNHRIGFVFQNYNLIPHQTILQNVRLALTLSGVSKKESIRRAKHALKEVGLADHIDKRPAQLSGGQMQRVAIARALVNDPDIVLADEPTGALDSTTSIQIMDLLKKISRDRLVIMVTHNPDLAEEYATRIITLKDGKITSDSNPYNGKEDIATGSAPSHHARRKTKMSFFTALSLSLKNLLTKKARTILVSIAGSIGIIGIALISAVSTGFQNYINTIEEDTLTSYPLTLMEESADLTGVLLSITGNAEGAADAGKVKENQVLTDALGSVSHNDLASFMNYLDQHQSEVNQDIRLVEKEYNVDPVIYTVDQTGQLAKLNPSNLFSSLIGDSSLLSSYSSLTSVFQQQELANLQEETRLVAGRYPEKYDELVISLSNPNQIPDLMTYSLGFHDTNELNEILAKILGGEAVSAQNEPLELTYDDLMNADLRLVPATATYQYNDKYGVYEDMSEDKAYMQNVYDHESEKLKIVGIVTPSSDMSTMGNGVFYLPSLITHIIDQAAQTEIVQKQLAEPDINIFSNAPFGEDKNNFDFELSDPVSVDSDAIQQAFGVTISQDQVAAVTTDYINDASSNIDAGVNGVPNMYQNLTNKFTESANGILLDFQKVLQDPNIQSQLANSNSAETYLADFVNSYLSNVSFAYLASLSPNIMSADNFKNAFSGLLQAYLGEYVAEYGKAAQTYQETLNDYFTNLLPEKCTSAEATKYQQECLNLSKLLDPGYTPTPTDFPSMPIFTPPPFDPAVFLAEDQWDQAVKSLAVLSAEAYLKQTILTKFANLTQYLSTTFANSFHLDQNALLGAFKLNFSQDELTRVISAMFNEKEATLSSNLSDLGYQNLDSPTRVAFYFTSFDGKTDFIAFLDHYNDQMRETGDEDKVIDYSDTTGVLMSSVKVIFDAVSYVLIAFVSISLVVSSIMIGVITYISVYERTKEIGILRAIGASKHNISSIFNAETFIIGLLAGVFAIAISYLLIPIINVVLHHFIGDVPLNAALAPSTAILLVLLSIVLTLIGGLIPAHSASKKDPVEALRSE